jgi:hypothetical protein
MEMARERIKTIPQAEKIPLGVEAVAGFKTSLDNLREVIPDVPMRETPAVTDKLTRAFPWIALAEAGRVYLVNGRFLRGRRIELAQLDGYCAAALASWVGLHSSRPLTRGLPAGRSSGSRTRSTRRRFDRRARSWGTPPPRS